MQEEEKVKFEEKELQSKTTMILISFFLGGLGIHGLF